MRPDSISSFNRDASLYSTPPAQQQAWQKLPKDVLEAMEQGDLEEAMRLLQLHSQQENPHALLLFLKELAPKLYRILLQQEEQLHANQKHKQQGVEKKSDAESTWLRSTTKTMRDFFVFLMQGAEWLQEKKLPLQEFSAQMWAKIAGKMSLLQALFAKESNRVTEPVKIAFEATVHHLQPRVEQAANLANELAKRMREFADKQKQKLQEVAEKVLLPIKETLNLWMEKFQHRWDQETQRLQTFAEGKIQAVVQVADQMRQVVIPVMAPVLMQFRRISSYGKGRVQAGSKRMGNAFGKASGWVKKRAISGFEKTVEYFSQPMLVIGYVLYSLFKKIMELVDIVLSWFWKWILVLRNVIPIYSKRFLSRAWLILRATPNVLFFIVIGIPKGFFSLSRESLRKEN